MLSASLCALRTEVRGTVRSLEPWRCLTAFFSSVFLAFGLYHVHSVSGITEGGVLGATLLLDHWFSLSPAVSGFVMNLLCYAWGWRLLGKSFIAYSLIATVGFSAAYKVFELFPPLWPQLAELPLLAAVLGALFVGVGAGLSVRAGGGFIVQLLPGAPEELAGRLEENVMLMDQLTIILDEDGTEAVAQQVLRGLEPRLLERDDVTYKCYCSRGRIADGLASLGAETLESLASEGDAEVDCRFCGEHYVFTPDELRALAKAEKNKKAEE